MSIAREIVMLEEGFRHRVIDLFAPVERGGLLEAAEASGVARRIESLGLHDSLRVMRLCFSCTI